MEYLYDCLKYVPIYIDNKKVINFKKHEETCHKNRLKRKNKKK